MDIFCGYYLIPNHPLKYDLGSGVGSEPTKGRVGGNAAPGTVESPPPYRAGEISILLLAALKVSPLFVTTTGDFLGREVEEERRLVFVFREVPPKLHPHEVFLREAILVW